MFHGATADGFTTHEQVGRMTITQVINRANKRDPRIPTYSGAAAVEFARKLDDERKAWERK